MEETELMLQRLLDAAARHGEQSDPDMEAGDLAEILQACWKRLSFGQRRLVFDECKEIVEEWGPEADNE
jgi:hypothetical protein